MFRNCEKCDFNCSCEVKDADHCPFDDPKVYLGEPVQPRVYVVKRRINNAN